MLKINNTVFSYAGTTEELYQIAAYFITGVFGYNAKHVESAPNITVTGDKYVFAAEVNDLQLLIKALPGCEWMYYAGYMVSSLYRDLLGRNINSDIIHRVPVPGGFEEVRFMLLDGRIAMISTDTPVPHHACSIDGEVHFNTSGRVTFSGNVYSDQEVGGLLVVNSKPTTNGFRKGTNSVCTDVWYRKYRREIKPVDHSACAEVIDAKSRAGVVLKGASEVMASEKTLAIFCAHENTIYVYCTETNDINSIREGHLLNRPDSKVDQVFLCETERHLEKIIAKAGKSATTILYDAATAYKYAHLMDVMYGTVKSRRMDAPALLTSH